MELTREEIEKWANVPFGIYSSNDYQQIAKQLLAEMDKPKVWDNAPDEASKCCVIYMHGERDVHCAKYNNYTRTLTKSHEREIAEKYADKWDIHCDSIEQRRVADVIESAINEYKEWEAER